MPAQKRLHMQPTNQLGAEVTLFSQTPRLQQEKNEPEKSFIRRCFGRATVRRVRQGEWKGCWLNLPESSEHISQTFPSLGAALQLSTMPTASCTLPALLFLAGLQHLLLCLHPCCNSPSRLPLHPPKKRKK